MTSEVNSITADQEILAQVAAGMTPQATVRIQIRQMKALERIADAAETIAEALARPAAVAMEPHLYPLAESLNVADPLSELEGHAGETHPVGPALQHTPPGSGFRARRRPGGDAG